MANFSAARAKVKKWEGGWSAGFKGSGETYRGFDRLFNASWPGWAIIDKIPNKKQNQIFDNPALDKLVEDHFFANYWKPSRAGEIHNDELATFFYDFYFHKPMQAVVACNTAAKEINASVTGSNGSLSNAVLSVMNTHPEAVYARVFQLRELHYKNKWMNKVGKNDYTYNKSQKGLLNRLYDFPREIGKKKRIVDAFNPDSWFNRITRDLFNN